MKMTSTMQNPSIVLYGAGNAKLQDSPVPEILENHDVIVKIAFVGVCGSDVHFWNHGGIGKHVSKDGIVMGHEASGIIHALGPQCGELKVGDRVAIEPGLPCRHCNPCKSGSYHLCKSMRFAAAPGPPDTQGTLCKYYKSASDFVYKIPDDISLEEAVLVEPLSVAVHSVKLADVKPGETVVVMGSGTIGALCAVVARVFGATRIIVADVLESKLSFVKEYLKECEVFKPDPNVDAETNAATLLKKFGLEEVDTVIEASGAASSIEVGIRVLRRGGKYVQTGMGKRKVEFPIAIMCEKELMVRGCFRYSAGDYELAVSLLSRGTVDVKPLISSMSKFEEATTAWEKTKRGEGIKNLIRGVEN